MADQYIEVPGGANNNNYANVTRIVEIAETYKADVVKFKNKNEKINFNYF